MKTHRAHQAGTVMTQNQSASLYRQVPVVDKKPYLIQQRNGYSKHGRSPADLLEMQVPQLLDVSHVHSVRSMHQLNAQLPLMIWHSILIEQIYQRLRGPLQAFQAEPQIIGGPLWKVARGL